ncbi:MAG: hypothetical protein KDC98_02680, partial [Planctomycetes bacterium]|nr:hypothetical protein [Planctomycetota bacterium]
MRRFAVCLPLAFAGCATDAGSTGSAAVAAPRPDVAEVMRLPPGALLASELAGELPDEPGLRAAAIWWREALRQSDRFDVDAGPGNRDCPAAAATMVLAVEDGALLLLDGGVAGARSAFQAARRDDGGSPWVLDGLAKVALLGGDPGAAERLCREALGYEQRLSPACRHTLARTLLLARASAEPTAAPARDRDLLALGEVYCRERPHDPEGRLSVAIAHGFLADFAAARPLLEALALRLPRHAVVSYHLGWACLGTDDPRAAIAHFEDAALRLPAAWVVIPRAIAHYAAADHAGLERLLDRLAADADSDSVLVHELDRMRAAHALLRGDDEAAARAILGGLNWLLKHPSVLDLRPGELAESGEVLVRLGHGDGLPALVAAVLNQAPPAGVADACAYLSGLVDVQRRRVRNRELEDRLGRGGENAFASRLEAFAYEVRGELGDMHAALARAAR